MIVEKLWGYEKWIVNEPEYCLKLMVVNPGFQCSLHYHRIKKETFYIMDGILRLETINRDGETVIEELDHRSPPRTLRPGKVHRFMSASETKTCRFFEVSTHHDDSDVVRIEPSRPWHKVKNEPVVSV